MGACLRFFLRYLDESNGRRKVQARRHPIPDLVQIRFQVLLECCQRLPIHTRSTAVRFDPLVRSPNELLRNIVRLCLRHRLLPFRVDLWSSARLSDPFAPPALLGFIATASRPVPPCLASVLGSSWVHHLEFSLHIRACRFPRSTREPARSSRRLCAGHRSGSRQASPELHPGPTTGARFR